MATAPSPRTWVVGETVTAAKMNELRDALNFMLSPPLFQLTHASNQTVATSTNASLACDTELVDRDNGHSTVTNNSRYTSQTAGYYLLTATCPWVANATGKRELTLLYNGGTTETHGSSVPGVAGGYVAPTTTGRLYLAVNDYVEARVWQNSGGNLDTSQASDGGIRFEGHWISK